MGTLLINNSCQKRPSVIVSLHDFGMAPAYLAQDVEKMSDVDARRRLHTGSSSALVVPPTRRSTIGDRSYQVAGPRAWNSLPTSVRDQLTLLTFRSHLKTFLFSLSFD